jgi:hypothetical protein
MDRVIGVDFDNTIVGYDDLLHRLAAERGLIEAGARKSKKSIRDCIRLLPDGEVEWQKLQAVMYGPRMGEAVLIEGVASFFRRCRATGAKVFIVSHKTQYAGYDETRTPLPAAALAWLRARGFFEAGGLGLSEERAYFEPTRAAKLDRVRALGCTHFIDDLEETFLEPTFPNGVVRALFNPHREPVSARNVRNFSDWRSIEEDVFGAC